MAARVRLVLPVTLARLAAEWCGFAAVPSSAIRVGAEGPLWAILAGAVAHGSRCGLCMCHRGRVSVARQGVVCGLGAGFLSIHLLLGALPCTGGCAIRCPFQEVAARRVPAVAEQTDGGGSVVGCRGSPRRTVALAGAARGCCVPFATGGRGSFGTAGIGASRLCPAWLAPWDGGYGSSGRCACAGHPGCGEPPCGATATTADSGCPGYRPWCVTKSGWPHSATGSGVSSWGGGCTAPPWWLNMTSGMVQVPSGMWSISLSSHRVVTWRRSCFLLVFRGGHGSRMRAAARSASVLWRWASPSHCP